MCLKYPIKRITSSFLLGLLVSFCYSTNTLKTHFTYKVAIPNIPDKTNKITLWVPIPSSGAMQNITNLKVDSAENFKIRKENKYGNSMVYLSFTQSTVPITAS